MMQRISNRLLTAALVGLLAGCAAPRAPGAAVAATPSAEASAPPRANQPAPECLAMLDRLSAGIPGDETGVVLRGKGLRIATPIRVPDGLITETAEVSAARVRVMIDRTGRVVPGSVSVQQSVGDPKLPLAMSSAVPNTLSFDVSGAFTVPKEFPFTTVYVSCAKR